MSKRATSKSRGAAKTIEDAAIESETRALLNLCEREARWTADNLTAKLVMQRVESFAKSRLNPPRPSFFDAF